MELIINSPKYGDHTVLIDDEDAHLIAGITWHIQPSKKTFYVRSGPKHGRVFMHVLIMGKTGVDHISRNGLDNRKNNLRFATLHQNARNKGIPKNNTTGFKGVCFDKVKNSYRVSIRVNKKMIRGGNYRNLTLAALAYNKLAIKYFGEFAYLNTPTNEQLMDTESRLSINRRANNKTGYRGVCFNKNSGKFVSTISVNKKNVVLGYFQTATEAATAYNLAVERNGLPREYLNIII